MSQWLESVPLAKRISAALGVIERHAATIGSGISLCLLITVIYELRYNSFVTVDAVFKEPIFFWLVFLIGYLASPVFDYVIYERLWGVRKGLPVSLLSKLVANELLMGYLGDLQFFAWAQKISISKRNIFFCFKDVSILSALAGNLVTLILCATSWPAIRSVDAGLTFSAVFISLLFVLAISFVLFAGRKMLFSLERHELLFILLMHVLRIALAMSATAGLWIMLLPRLPLSMAFLMVTVRMLVSRLPLVPNKDLIFSGLTMAVFGRGDDLSAVIATVAALTIVTHICLAAVLSVRQLALRLRSA